MIAANALPNDMMHPTTPIKDPTANELIHFFSDEVGGEFVRALENYGRTVVVRELDYDIAAADTLESGVVVIDMPQQAKGLSLCRRLRAAGIDFPLVMLTASIDPFDEVLGLELGADEFVSNSVHPRVLLARLRAISRRVYTTPTANKSAQLIFGALRIDGLNRDVMLNGQRIGTTSGEFDLLWLLARHAGQVMPRDEVLLSLRGLSNLEASRSVDARLYRLRRRFGDMPSIRSRIKTVRPFGYMFANVPW